MVIVYLLISHLIFNYLRQGDVIPSAICGPQHKLYCYIIENIFGPKKKEGIWIGSARYRISKAFDIWWPDEPMKAFGVYFTYDLKLLEKKNFTEHLDSMSMWFSGLNNCRCVSLLRMSS